MYPLDGKNFVLDVSKIDIPAGVKLPSVCPNVVACSACKAKDDETDKPVTNRYIIHVFWSGTLLLVRCLFGEPPCFKWPAQHICPVFHLLSLLYILLFFLHCWACFHSDRHTRPRFPAVYVMVFFLFSGMKYDIALLIHVLEELLSITIIFLFLPEVKQ